MRQNATRERIRAYVGNRARGLDDIEATGAAWITEKELAEICAELRSLRYFRSRVRREADAVAEAIGERGLLDLADDVKMLGRL